MKRTSILLLIIVCAFIKGQAQTDSVIENTQSPNHIEIPGTKYLLIKPDDSFTTATNFIGLESKELESGINITELPMSFDAVLPMFSKDIPPQNGKLLIERDFKFNGYEAKLYKTEVNHKSALDELSNPVMEGKPINSWLMIFGDEEICFIIGAIYASSKDTELSEKIEKSLFSFIYLKDKVVDQLAGLAYSVETGNTPLKFATILMQTGVIFNMDGNFPGESEDNTTYMIMMMPYSVEAHEQREVAVQAVDTPYKENVEIKEVKSIVIDGLEGFEVIGYERNEDNELVLNYAVTLFDTERYFVITGESKLDHLEMFKIISNTFKVKP